MIAGERRQVRYITSTTMPAGMPITTSKQPSLVMQLIMVNGSRASFKAKLMGQITKPSSLKIIYAVAH